MSEEETEEVISSVAPERADHIGETTSSLEGNKDEKPIPHYLRPSAGSCHDFCKYGRKHASDVKKRRPVLPTFLSNNKFSDEDNNLVKHEERRPRIIKKTRSQVMAEKSKSKFSERVSPHAKAEVMTKELITVSTVNKSSEYAEGLPDEPNGSELIASPPVEKHIIFDASTPEKQAEGSLQQPIDNNLDLEMSTRAKKNIIPGGHKGSSENCNEIKHWELPEISLVECIDPSGENTAEADSNLASLATATSEKPSNTEVTEVTCPSIQESSFPAEKIQIDGGEESSEGSISKDLDNTPLHEINTGECGVLPSEELKDMNVQIPTITKEIVVSRKSAKPKGHICVPKSCKRTKSNILSMQDKKGMVKSPNTDEKKKGEAIQLKFTRQMLLSASKDKVLVQNGSDLSPSKTIPSVKPKLSPRSVKKPITSAKPGMLKLKAASPPKKADVRAVSSFVLKKSSLPSLKNPDAFAKPRAIKLKATSPPKKSHVPSASSIFLEQRTSLMKPTFSLASGGLKIRRRKEEKSSDVGISQFSASKLSRTMLMKRRNTLASSQVKKNESAGNDENSANIKEKTLYVVSAKTVEASAKLMQQRSRNRKSSSASETSSTASASASNSSYGKEEHEDSESAHTDASERNHTTRSKVVDRRRVRTPSVHAEAETPAPRKLKFRRGKVINPQAADNNVPRRLRFRQPRTIDQNRNAIVEAVNRTFMKKELGGGEMNGAAGSETPPTVVLRRQDHQQDKKDMKSLFNHVIEETASKLVETRKSKVKALVGAFETVISLQESKPASTV